MSTLPSKPLPGEAIDASEAERIGAFREDALSESEAIAASTDPRIPPAEALQPPRKEH